MAIAPVTPTDPTNDFEVRLARIEAFLGFTQTAPVEPAVRQAQMQAEAVAAAAAEKEAERQARGSKPATHLDDAEHQAERKDRNIGTPPAGGKQSKG